MVCRFVHELNFISQINNNGDVRKDIKCLRGSLSKGCPTQI